MRYTFGHTITAAQRLQQIAEFFNPLACHFICDNREKNYNRVVDLGCGPGYTTNMLAKATASKEVVGIDISDYFIELARNEYPDYKFIKGDVANLNLNEKYDLLYCRFLLSHLRGIHDLFNNWISLLNPGGIICIDELEDIFTGIPVFKRYLEVNSALIRSQGAELYIGKKLNDQINGFQVKYNQSKIIAVPDSLAAGWFFPNTISIWETEEFVRNNISPGERKTIAKKLLQIQNNRSKTSNITWKMKRIILTN